MAKGNRVEKDGSNFLRRSAKEIKTYRIFMKIMPIAAACMTMAVVLTFVASMLYTRYGSFTVTVNRLDQSVYALSLSEYWDFNAPTERLNSKASKDITNISVLDLPKDLDTQDGEHNGDNYVAYTFYAKNVGKETVDCEWEIFIKNMTLDIEKAVRVRVYTGDIIKAGSGQPKPEDRHYVDYARAASDGIGDGTGAEPGTTPFYSTKIICRDTVKNFGVGDMVKFTVVIWLEGDDPECLNNIIGGQFKIDMSMRIMNPTGEEEETITETFNHEENE